MTRTKRLKEYAKKPNFLLRRKLKPLRPNKSRNSSSLKRPKPQLPNHQPPPNQLQYPSKMYPNKLKKPLSLQKLRSLKSRRQRRPLLLRRRSQSLPPQLCKAAHRLTLHTEVNLRKYRRQSSSRRLRARRQLQRPQRSRLKSMRLTLSSKTCINKQRLSCLRALRRSTRSLQNLLKRTCPRRCNPRKA